MRTVRFVSIPLLLLLALVGCDGSLTDIWNAFPTSSFGDEDGDGDGPTTPAATEVFGLESTHGVTGDVRNLDLVQITGGPMLALLSAGADGVHIVDVTDPGQVSASSYLATINNARLSLEGVEIAGGRVDALTVVDNRWLVCLAVGTGAENAVTVFDIQIIYGILSLDPSADLSAGFVLPTGESAIAVPGSDGRGGGVAGSGSLFVVATGGPELGVATIQPGDLIAQEPSTWTAQTPFQDAAVNEFLDVLYQSQGGAGLFYASVRSGTEYGIVGGGVATADPPVVTLTSEVTPVEGERFETIINDRITGPGNHPLDLSLDMTTLYAAGDNQVVAFNITNPASPQAETSIEATGTETIAVHANSGAVAVGAKDAVRVYSAVGGTRTLVSETFYEGTFTIRSVELVFAGSSSYVLACAGTRGLRILEWVAITSGFGDIPR
jgi:hypothetical protein